MPAPLDAISPGSSRCEVWFDDPEGAYLAASAIRRYVDPELSATVILLPSEHGPALEMPASTVSDRLVGSLLRRFGGRLESRQGLDLEAARFSDD